MPHFLKLSFFTALLGKKSVNILPKKRFFTWLDQLIGTKKYFYDRPIFSIVNAYKQARQAVASLPKKTFYKSRGRNVNNIFVLVNLIQIDYLVCQKCLVIW